MYSLIFWKQIIHKHSETVKYRLAIEVAQSDNEPLSLFNPRPAEPGYVLHLQTVSIQISRLPNKPTDQDLHCLPLSM